MSNPTGNPGPRAQQGWSRAPRWSGQAVPQSSRHLLLNTAVRTVFIARSVQVQQIAASGLKSFSYPWGTLAVGEGQIHNEFLFQVRNLTR